MDVRDLFTSRNLRCTKQRELIYAALAATDAHPTAEELYNMVREQEPGLSLATVYNTLEALAECGLCRRFPCPTGSGACRFDAVTEAHVHLTTADARIVDIPADLSDRLLSSLPADLLAEIERRMGTKVRGVQIHLTAAPAN